MPERYQRFGINTNPPVMRTSCFIFFFGLLQIGLMAQVRQDFCSTRKPGQTIFVDVEKLLEERRRIVAVPEVVEVFVHFTTDDAGVQTIVSMDTFMARFQNMKDLFFPHDICFLLVGSQIIQNTDLDDHHIFGMGANNNEQDEVLPYLKPGVLNVFVHHVLTFGNLTGGGNAYSIPNTYLSLDDGALSGECCVGTLAHEVGHCLGLYHTFEWSWGSGYQNQVKEKVPRTGNCVNCTTEGDLLCDTPADPHELASFWGIDTFFLLVWEHMTNCVFDTVILDNCGDLFDPDETNMMSYFPDSCHTNFTTGQGLRALSFLNGQLADLKAPENLVINQNVNHHSGEYMHAAKEHVTYSASNLIYSGTSILWTAAGISVSVLPGTTFSPGTGYALLSAQNTCQ